MPVHTYTNWNTRPSDAEEQIELITEGEKSNIIGITNPGFEVFILLHIEGAYEKFIKDNNDKFFELDEKKRYRHPYNVLLEATGMNSKKNSKIGDLAENVAVAVEQEKSINQDIHNVKGVKYNRKM